MIDAWLGRILDALDRRGLWETTAVVVCTDHGHYLGEKDIWGKPAVPVYEPLGHIPLLIAWPGVAPRAVDALTTSVDIAATLAELFGVGFAHRTHGRSLLPLIHGAATAVREAVLSGVWGREVHVVTDHRKYARAPRTDNAPLAVWSNRWSTMPVHRLPQLRLPRPDERAALARMPGSRVPVIRQPFAAGDALPFWAWGDFSGNHLYDLRDDPQETRNLAGTAAERDAADALRAALEAVEAPPEQFARLGLT
jgi:arylsulfatase A-like enzyme